MPRALGPSAICPQVEEVACLLVSFSFQARQEEEELSIVQM
jgi:hypothetical protein